MRVLEELFFLRFPLKYYLEDCFLQCFGVWVCECFLVSFFSLGWLLKLSLIVIVEVRGLGDLPDHIKLCVSLYFVFGCMGFA